MNLCKVNMELSKAMKSTWLTTRSGVTVCVGFKGAKKRPAKVKQLDDLIDITAKGVLKPINILRPRPQVTPDQKTSRITSILKPSKLGKNDKQPACRKVMTRECQKQERSQIRNYIQ